MALVLRQAPRMHSQAWVEWPPTASADSQWVAHLPPLLFLLPVSSAGFQHRMCARLGYAGSAWGQRGYSHRQAAATACGRKLQNLAGLCSLSENLLFSLLNTSEVVICTHEKDVPTVTAVLSVFHLPVCLPMKPFSPLYIFVSVPVMAARSDSSQAGLCCGRFFILFYFIFFIFINSSFGLLCWAQHFICSLLVLRSWHLGFSGLLFLAA